MPLLPQDPEQLLPNMPWGIISVKAQNEDYETPVGTRGRARRASVPFVPMCTAESAVNAWAQPAARAAGADRPTQATASGRGASRLVDPAARCLMNACLLLPRAPQMQPITMMRNALGREEGGSGVPLNRWVPTPCGARTQPCRRVLLRPPLTLGRHSPPALCACSRNLPCLTLSLYIRAERRTRRPAPTGKTTRPSWLGRSRAGSEGAAAVLVSPLCNRLLHGLDPKCHRCWDSAAAVTESKDEKRGLI